MLDKSVRFYSQQLDKAVVSYAIAHLHIGLGTVNTLADLGYAQAETCSLSIGVSFLARLSTKGVHPYMRSRLPDESFNIAAFMGHST